MEFRDYPEWEELDLTPRPWPTPKKEKALKTNTRKKLLKELEQAIEEIHYDSDYLGLRKKPFEGPTVPDQKYINKWIEAEKKYEEERKKLMS